MEGLFLERWSYIAYLLGGALFLIGSGRLLSRGDGIGAAIFAVTGCLAIILAVAGNLRRMRGSGSYPVDDGEDE
jgi:Na+/proline symporter